MANVGDEFMAAMQKRKQRAETLKLSDDKLDRFHLQTKKSSDSITVSDDEIGNVLKIRERFETQTMKLKNELTPNTRKIANVRDIFTQNVQ